MIPKSSMSAQRVCALMTVALITIINIDCTALDNFVLPADATVWDVTDYGAIGDGITDDTSAIQTAIDAAMNSNDRYSAPKMIYMPNGTYLISDSLEARLFNTTTWNGWRAGLFLQGQSQNGTIIKLANNTTGFGNASSPLPMIKTGSEGTGFTNGGGNQAFRHYIRNLTLDVGSGNPGAIGIDYMVNNRGAIEDVTIRSSDPNGAGYTGLAMDRGWPGPGMVRRVTVEGFEYGISLRSQAQYSMVLKEISVSNQSVCGLLLDKNTLSLEDFISTNNVPAIHVTDGRAHLVVINASLNGVSGQDAIVCKGKLYARNVQSIDYDMVIDDTGSNNRDATGGSGTTVLTEHTTFGPFSAFSGMLQGAMQLPIEDFEVYHTDNLSVWENVATHGAIRNDGNDDLAALQATIDAGNPIVYLPQGNYHVSNTLVVRGNVRTIIGLAASIKLTSSFPAGAPTIRFDGAAPEGTALQFLRVYGTLEHNSKRTLAIKNCDVGSGYQNSVNGVGKLFLEDVIMGMMTIDYPQKIWARQLNIELSSGDYITNNGADMWIFGYKTENKNGSVLVNNGGRVELFGGFFYPHNGSSSFPMLVNNEGELSATYKKDDLTTNNYPVHVRDIRNGQTIDFAASSVPSSNNCALYSSAVALASTPEPAAQWALDNYTQDSGPGGIHGTLVNGAAFSTATTVGSHALVLDGVDDYMLISNGSSGLMHNAFTQKTVALWFNADETASNQILFDEGGRTNGIAIGINNGLLQAAVRNYYVQSTVSSTIAAGVWTHVAVTYDQGKLALYLDGVLTDAVNNAPTSIAHHNSDAALGASVDDDTLGNDTTVARYFGGLLDDLRIYESAILPVEVSVLVGMESSVAESALMEVGELYADQAGGGEWHTVNFASTFIDPVVIISPPSYNGSDPSTVRVRQVTPLGFEFQLDEWDYLDGAHTDETFFYLVVEAGVHQIGGKTWIAGNQSGVTNSWVQVNFPQNFSSSPMVLAQAVTRNDTSAVTSRLRNRTSSKFEVRLQQQENDTSTITAETVAYIAFQTGSGTEGGFPYEILSSTGCTEAWKTRNFSSSYSVPAIFAQIQSFSGTDPSALRYTSLNGRSVDVFIEEEESQDVELDHASETVGFLIFELGN